MVRLLAAVALVCALSYVLFPHDFAVVAGRAEATVHAAASAVAGAVRSAVATKKKS